MSDAKHTKGHWFAKDWCICIYDDDGELLVLGEVRPWSEDAPEEAQANARLMAASPLLLKACQQALYALKGREHDGFLRDAIASATGEQHV